MMTFGMETTSRESTCIEGKTVEASMHLSQKSTPPGDLTPTLPANGKNNLWWSSKIMCWALSMSEPCVTCQMAPVVSNDRHGTLIIAICLKIL